MKFFKSPVFFSAIFLTACASLTSNHIERPNVDTSTPMRAAAANIVEAVNAKDAERYGFDLHPEVIVKMYQGEVRLRGKTAVIENRRQHFTKHPKALNHLVHLVEIDNRVVMHDTVWLDGDKTQTGADIVEVFTFEDGKIIQVEVIQPADLFNRRN